MTKITIQEVKSALRDPNFRNKLPESLKPDIQKYEQNPGCACNLPIYHNVIRFAPKLLREYYPNKELINIDEELTKMAENHWTVINCHVDELENKLKSLPSGRKQLAITRWQDQCTVVVNELDFF